MRLSLRSFSVVAACALPLLCGGCGGAGNLPVAKVTGQVTCEGEPVTSGSIAFTPVASGNGELPGKPALGKVNSDGTFQLTTYQPNDGAIVGKHRVSITFPGQELGGLPGEQYGDDSPPQRLPQGLPPCAAAPRVIEVEVEAGGDNSFTIELSDD
ncbi:MAG: hypothetical protein KDA58_06445 [Planctomycetaceae bacterium]|nr:hypothetical protein [Planctomycetaceae bacterium]